MINDVTKAQVNLLNVTQKTERGEAQGKSGSGKEMEGKETGGDRVTLNTSGSGAATYGKPVGATQQVAAKLQVTSQIVSTLFTQQGGVDAIGSQGAVLNDQITQLLGKFGIATTIDIGGGNTADLASLSQADAQKLIASDGYWGVGQTSDRIASFALNAAGNDPEKLQQVKDAVMKGYEMAKETFGGYLPDISQKTIDAVMAKLDNPAQQGESQPVV